MGISDFIAVTLWLLGSYMSYNEIIVRVENQKRLKQQPNALARAPQTYKVGISFFWPLVMTYAIISRALSK